MFFRGVLWALLVFGFLLVVLLAVATWQVYTKQQDARRQHFNEAETVAELTARKAALQTELSSLDTDRGIETEVRERYPVEKPGEQEIMLVAPKQSDTGSSTPKTSLWDTILRWLPW